MTFYQLNPTIPLRSPKASGEAVAVIDMSLEHDLMWVVIDDTTGQVWTVPNKDVRAYANYSAGRNLKPEPPRRDDYAERLLASFITQYLAQPGETERFLRTCIDRKSLIAALEMIANRDGDPLPEGTPDWMPDFMGEAKP
jgi:hypothetical protein